MYYADVAIGQYPPTDRHGWDADGNRVYGERYEDNKEIDQVNGIADVFVGRIPVKTADEVNIFIDKVIRYEKFRDKDDFLLPMKFAVSVLLGSANWERTDDPNHLDRSAVVSENIYTWLLDYAKKNGMEHAHPPRWLITRCYEDSANANDPSVIHASHDTMIAAIESNHNAVSLISHGSHTGLCFISSDDIKTIENTPGIFFGCACNTAMFDVPGNEAIGEWAIRNPKGGAVAYIGETRMGSTGDGPIAIAFWQSLPTSERLGEMFQASQGVMNKTTRYIYNLLGDPAMRVWSDRPRQLSVSHPEEICTGYQLFGMTVTSKGQPVQDAVCCITMGETIFATFKTDASGKGSCFISPTTEGTMYVTVSGKNLIPYLGSTIVKVCDSKIPLVVKVFAWTWIIFIGALLIAPNWLLCIKCGVSIDALGYIGDPAVVFLGIGSIILGFVGLTTSILGVQGKIAK